MAKKLVIIDEQAAARQRVRQAAASPVDTVLEFTTAEEALKIMEAFQPDCVMLGVSCPPPNSYRDIQNIRKKMPEVRLVAVNTFSDDEMRGTAKEAGASGYVSMENLSELFLLAAPERLSEEISPRRIVDSKHKK